MYRRYTTSCDIILIMSVRTAFRNYDDISRALLRPSAQYRSKTPNISPDSAAPSSKPTSMSEAPAGLAHPSELLMMTREQREDFHAIPEANANARREFIASVKDQYRRSQ